MHVQQHGVVDLTERLEQLNERFDIVAVHRAEVGNVQALEQLARRQSHADGLFDPLDRLLDAAADARDVFEDVLRRRTQPLIGLAQPDPREVFRHGAYGHVDCHAVVVQHDQHLPLDEPEVVQTLERSAVDDAGIADQRDDPRRGRFELLEFATKGLWLRFLFLRLQLLAEGHADGGRNRGAGVSDGELVVVALLRVRKPADAAGVSQEVEARLAAGDDLVCVALVAYIPQELVLLEIEDVMQRQRQFDGAEIARQVPPGPADGIENELPDLLR